jgi:hypothetical protein
MWILKFPDLIIHAPTLDALGGQLPRTVYEIYRVANKQQFTCHYLEADETFEGGSIVEVALKVQDFLNGDSCVVKSGNYVLEEQNIKVMSRKGMNEKKTNQRNSKRSKMAKS